MAEKKKKAEKSAVALEAERLRKVASDAKERAKSGNQKDKDAYDKAKAAADAATAKENRERMIRVGNGRYIKAFNAIGQLEALANTKTYTADAADYAKLTDGLQGELDRIKALFNRVTSGEKVATKKAVVAPLT